jgi:cytochrome b6-f complex iron-sulfur subunit
MEEMTRRTALRLTAGAVVALGSASCAAGAAPDNPSGASGSPRPSTASTPSLRELATVAVVPDGGVIEVTAAAGQPAYLLRSGDSIRLLSATCTHARCQVAWVANSRQFQCPCHQGRYDSQGQVVSGPPPRALDDLPVVINEGTIYLDR